MIFFVGILISFLGQLPIGYINLIAVKTAIEQSTKAAIFFSIGIAIVEVLYLIIIMYSLRWIISNEIIYTLLQIITAIVFIVLGVISFFNWKKNRTINKTASNTYHTNAFVNGLLLSGINLAQFPFWILWTNYLISIKLLSTNTTQYPTFIIGTGIGTILGLLFYILGGKYLLEKMKKIASNLELLIAVFFIVAAGFQIFHWLKS
jgi:threonine/homoserine/homoserine lactone efflux protein